ncbi:hypothetical protein [Tabrizicola sp.]|uniref:hypothetical protein n=1 Tax=Tabrizicola sp. TaxID=2005166 RepID=UPI003F400763
MLDQLKLRLPSKIQPIWWICLAGMALVFVNAIRSLPQISQLLLEADGDDLMRLVQVRDWLAGQGWFDMRQYRVLPPEGISMHWSRYVDVGIAAILVPASWVLPPAQAELATVVLWPSLLGCLMVVVIAHGTNRLLGKGAAVGALAVFLSWSKLGGEFVPPRIDHHNVQLLCATAIFYLALVPGRARTLGALAGAITAFSLAVGLEMLPFLALIWGSMALRYAFGQPQAGDWLLGYGVAITLAAPLLLAGQTPAADWLVNHCDVLAPPVLVLGGIGVVATLVPVLAGRVLTGAGGRLLVMVTITALGLWLFYPLLGRCVAGPYADVPPAVRQIIETRVNEALSAPSLLRINPELLARILLPAVIITTLAMAAALGLRNRLSTVQKTALIQALLVVVVGFAFAVIQIRATNLLAPAVPFLAGFLIYAFTLIPRTSPIRVPAIVLLVLAMPATIELGANQIAPHLAADAVMGGPPSATDVAGLPSECRTTTALAEISSLPQSVIFSTLNRSPMIIAYTPHAVASAAYHRSAAAFWNGIKAFDTNESLLAALDASKADYVVLCRDSSQEREMPYAGVLLSGNLPDWLTDVTADRQHVMVLKVDKAILKRQAHNP